MITIIIISLMKNYLLKTCLLLAVLCSATVIHAHDFEAVNEDGKTIYYNIISPTSKTCEVTYQGTSYNSKAYSGSLKIPEFVTYSSVEYRVTRIGEYAFSHCEFLHSVTLPNSVVSIEYDAFWLCGITSINLPYSVTTIGQGAFNYCKNLQSIILPNSIKVIGWAAFAGCSALSNIVIPNSVKSIDRVTFRNCSNLISIVIPDSVTSIGYDAFRYCNSLTSVVIGKSVKSIGTEAFAECTALTEVISNIETPFAINSNCFSGLAKMNATLYVPKGTKELYQARNGWDFVNIDDGLVYHQLTLTTNEGGSITYNGEKIENASASFEIREGQTATITVEPWDKYELSSLKMNGMNVKKYMEDNTFTTDEIDSDVEIVATFDLINPYITITPSAELQSFCSEKNLNFSEVNGLTAYIVTGYKPSANELLLTPVLEVPAGTGVLLKGDVGATYKVPFENSDYNYNNNLIGVLSDTEVTTGYVFDGVFKAVGGSAIVPANSAYLVLPAATNAGVSQLNLCITDGPAVKGDVNGDGRVDITDVVSLVNIVLGN